MSDRMMATTSNLLKQNLYTIFTLVKHSDNTKAPRIIIYERHSEILVATFSCTVSCEYRIHTRVVGSRCYGHISSRCWAVEYCTRRLQCVLPKFAMRDVILDLACFMVNVNFVVLVLYLERALVEFIVSEVKKGLHTVLSLIVLA
ncbi:unnamed protein product [Leptosia nina]|uniref:Uncharacterized protein n=1 Tax=Leptosia nina TaxID=320188 RepID=A0AAV1JTZ4_9NEOP